MELWKRLLKATVLAATLALILEIVTVGAYVAVGQPSEWAILSVLPNKLRRCCCSSVWHITPRLQ